jgi:hypothetical protein
MNVIQATEFLGGMHVGQEQVDITVYKSKGTVCRFLRDCRAVLDAMLWIRIRIQWGNWIRIQIRIRKSKNDPQT